MRLQYSVTGFSSTLFCPSSEPFHANKPHANASDANHARPISDHVWLVAGKRADRESENQLTLCILIGFGRYSYRSAFVEAAKGRGSKV